MSMSHHDDHPTLQEFHSWFDNSCVKGTLGPAAKSDHQFMPSKWLESYFKDSRRLRNILKEVFEPSDSPISPEAIQGKYEKVFGVLLRIKKGRFIRCFIEYPSLLDEKLPFDKRPTHFPTEGAEDFFESFYKQQWMFCPPVFCRGETKRYDPECILPIIYKEQISGGASAIVYKIVLHKSYNHLRGVRDSGQDQSDLFADTFVLKTYKTKNAEQYYKNEVDGFKKLQSHGGLGQNMITFYGSYIQGDSFNIILDYADEGTLEQYLRITGQLPAEDVIPFWRELFNVIKALVGIHEVTPDGLSAEMQIFQGWHQDVKLSNILIKSDPTSPFKRRFILADLGLSHFKSKMSLQEDSTDEDTRGTRTYGAPECYRSDDFVQGSVLRVKQKVDIWSLACVFSESATGILRGYDGIQKFRQLRMDETAKISGFRDPDCFHGGNSVLYAVGQWHKSISSDIRRGDHITAAVLELINEMFWDSSSRPDAMQLWKKSQEILKKAEKSPSTPPFQGNHQIRRRLSDSSQSPPHTPPMPPPSLPPYPQHHRNSQTAWTAQSNRVGSLAIAAGPRILDRTTGARVPLKRTTPGKRHTYEGTTSTSPSGSSRQWDIGCPNQGLGIKNDLTCTSPVMNRGSTSFHHTRSHSNRLDSLDIRVTNSSGLFPNYQRSYGWADGDIDPQPVPPVLGHAPPATNRYAPQLPSLPQDYLPPMQAPTATGSPKGQSPTTPTSTGWRPPPSLSLHDAQQFIAGKKSASSGKILRKAIAMGKRPVQDFRDEDLLDRLDSRDHVFLIDDSGSMVEHWNDVITLFQTLGYMVKLRDPDGIELQFMNSALKSKSRNTTPLLEKLKKVVPKGNSDISIRLDQILQDYEFKLQTQSGQRSTFSSKPAGPIRPMTIYVLTDGVWQPQCEYGAPIRRFVTMLEKRGLPEKQVGIQFIPFGNNPAGRDKLDHLDRRMGLPRDIVDTEAFAGGNIWKMLLGSLDRWFDGDIMLDMNGLPAIPNALGTGKGVESGRSRYDSS
ncbi:MAG: hypothetical protein M1813_000707 [Trichoglossum hirsutum]|nr:MAG: hypothetical protein M1813_000707 [Trichoglossum hirsutum]